VAKVDVTREQELKEAWQIDGFPALKLVAYGKVYSYFGARTTAAMESFARGGWESAVSEPLPKDRRPSAVVSLTDEDFDLRIQGGHKTPWFIKFYAPWCGHCKRLAPVWQELAGNLNGTIHVAKVDATKERSVAEEWGVSSYPQLRFVAEGKAYEYSGERTADALEQWAREGWKSDIGEPLPNQNSTSDVISLTSANFEESITRDTEASWFVQFFVPWCGHCKSLAPDWEVLAKKLKGSINVAKVDASKYRELSDQWVQAGFPTILLIAAGQIHTYAGNRSVEDMESWALERVPAPPGIVTRLLRAKVLGLDLALLLAFLFGVVVALLLWCAASRLSPTSRADKALGSGTKVE